MIPNHALYPCITLVSPRYHMSIVEKLGYLEKMEKIENK
jgi:hypothetical protein